MKSINKFFDFKRAGYMVSAFAVLLATALPSLAFADQVTERSIALSSSTKSAANTTYSVSFKAVTLAGAFVIDFCDSPAVGTVCNAPAGMNATSAASADFTAVSGSTNKIVVTDSISAGATVTGDITGITNPSNDGVFYARIVTFDNATSAGAYDSSSTGANNPGANAKDQGGVAMSITPTIGVSGAVLETLIFCASNHVLTSNCGGADAPNVVLGTNGILGNVASEGTIHSQISTNAASGAIVNLKSSATGCGGLLRAGTGTAADRCGIKPLRGTPGALTDGASLFGVKLAGLANGTGTVAASGDYSTTNFFMNYDNDGTEDTGVTSTYGDPIYNTVGAPISNGGVDLVFGANIGNDTPAGAYSANLSLIATGKF